VDDEKSRAKEGQKIHIVDLNKNVMFLVFAYLNTHEIFRLIKSSKRISLRIKADPYFNSVASEALSNFFL